MDTDFGAICEGARGARSPRASPGGSDVTIAWGSARVPEFLAVLDQVGNRGWAQQSTVTEEAAPAPLSAVVQNRREHGGLETSRTDA